MAHQLTIQQNNQNGGSHGGMSSSSSGTVGSSVTKSTKLIQFIRSELFPQAPSPDQQASSEDNAEGPLEDSAAAFAARRREKVYTFVTIPKELEKLMGYGFFQCADAFLYVFTFLPLRCVIAIYQYIWGWVNCRPVPLKPSDKCEMLKILILLVSSVLFMYIDTNVLYHVIKSQSVIKLYMFYNMLEVGDRLFGCFSQDTLDALFLTATEQTTSHSSTHSSPDHKSQDTSAPTKSRAKAIKKLSTTTHALICGISILGHALVILLQSTTLSVAINANNRVLLTVMMSNNFVELKGAVFKKFDKMNLFQVSCSDIRERFHLFILLLIVCLQTLREYSWEESRFWVLLPDCLMVLLAEIGVDWIKHAFITRFNELPLQVYEHYTRSLAYDMAESVKKKSNRFSSDYSDVVGRRLGFVPLPLAIVLIRVVSPSWKVSGDRMLGIVLLSICGYVGLASFRILNMVVLVGKAVKIIDKHCEETHNSANMNNDAVIEPLACSSPVAKNSILKRTRTISGSDGDLYLAMKQEQSARSDKKLTFEDELLKRGEAGDREGSLGKIHLLANSNVSLVSVGFNEEMMKLEETRLEENNANVNRFVISERKHSLGSNLDEGIMLLGKKFSEQEHGGSGDGMEEFESQDANIVGIVKIEQKEGYESGSEQDSLLEKTVIKVENEAFIGNMNVSVIEDDAFIEEQLGDPVKCSDRSSVVVAGVKEEHDTDIIFDSETVDMKTEQEDACCNTVVECSPDESGATSATTKKKKLINWFK